MRMSQPPAGTVKRALRRHGPVPLGLLVPILIAVAACGPKKPPPPLMSAVTETKGRYGYSEREIDGARVEISYFAPVRRVPPGATYRAPFTQAAIDLASDLALWRAAQLAKEREVPRFTVEKRRTDVVVDRYRGGYYPDPFFGPPWPYYYRYPWGYPFGFPYPYYSYEPPRAYGRAIVRMTVYFGTLADRRSQQTANVIDRMTQKYGTANAPAATSGSAGDS